MKKNKLAEVIRNLNEEDTPEFKRYYSELLAKFGVSTRGSIKDENKLQHFDNLAAKFKEEHPPEPAVEPVDPQAETEEVIDETSSSAASPGYLTPNAFAGGDGGLSPHRRKTATVLGMQLVKDPDKKKNESTLHSYIQETIKDFLNKKDSDDENMINESLDSYYFKDDTLTNEQKIGLAMRQVRNHLTEVGQVISKSIKLKQESGVNSDNYGKRTYQSLKKINEKVIKLMIALNEIK